MKTQTEATIDDLYKIEGKAEIVNGELVLMSPTQKLPSHAATRILVSLERYGEQTGLGYGAMDNLGYIVSLPHRQSFSPDVSFHTEDIDDEFGHGAPIFAVEVRCKGDYGPTSERKLAQKRADYFATGAQVVWDVDVLREQVIRVYRKDNPDEPTLYSRGEIAEAEPALPGWTFPVDNMFPRLRKRL